MEEEGCMEYMRGLLRDNDLFRAYVTVRGGRDAGRWAHPGGGGRGARGAWPGARGRGAP